MANLSRAHRGHPTTTTGGKPGYKQVYIPHDHPRKRVHPHQVSAPEHVLVVEQVLGKVLPKHAVVHHVNENRSDNRNQNLVVCEDRSYHMLLHSRQNVLKAGGNPNRDRVCMVCEELRPIEETVCANCQENRKNAQRIENLEHLLVLPQVGRFFLEGGAVEELASTYDLDDIRQLADWYHRESMAVFYRKSVLHFMGEKSCLVPGCKAHVNARGLCNSHYGVAKRLVMRGKTTWEDLERRHKVLPVRHEREYSRYADVQEWMLTEETASTPN